METNELTRLWKAVGEDTAREVKTRPADIASMIGKRRSALMERADRRLRLWTWIFGGLALWNAFGVAVELLMGEAHSFTQWCGLLAALVLLRSVVIRRRSLVAPRPDVTLKEATLLLRRRLRRELLVEFLTLLFLCGSAAAYMAFTTFGSPAFRAEGTGFKAFAVAAVVCLAAVPWIVRLVQRWRYESLLKTLDKEARLLEESE